MQLHGPAFLLTSSTFIGSTASRLNLHISVNPPQLTRIMTNSALDQEQLAELKEIFCKFDKDGDNSLTELELGSLLRSLGLKPNQQELEALLRRADTNSNGLVEFQEFVNLLAPELISRHSLLYTDEQLRALFCAFDLDGNGFISAAELAHSMACLGHALTANELAGMMGEADTDGDGLINYQEFVVAITSAAFEVAQEET